MLVPNEDIVSVFKKVKAVREHMALYHVDGSSHRLSVDSLAASIADMYGLKIEMFEVLAAGRHVGGNVERYADGRAVILIKSEQSEALRRFIAVKELCHLMIDEEDDWSSAGTTTIREMKTEFEKWKADGKGETDPSRAQKSEILAWVAAIVFMYPREFHLADQAKLDSDETSVAKIGLYHDMPPYEVESVFNLPGCFALYDQA